jgi:hypothetical protein
MFLLDQRQQLSSFPDRWEICSRSAVLKLDLFTPTRNFAGKLHLHLAVLLGGLGHSGNQFTWNTPSVTRWAGDWSRLQRSEEFGLED